jgi:uncharacterized membrane protein YukC
MTGLQKFIHPFEELEQDFLILFAALIFMVIQL